MTDQRVAAVITFFRDDRFFPDALASVLAQTRPADEIVVVDDASPPGTTTSLEHLDSRVQVLRLPVNGGAGAARQAGAEATTAPLIAYLDADDVWTPTKLARQLETFTTHPDLGAVHTGLVRFTAEGRETPFLQKPLHLQLATQLRRNQMMPSSVMLSRDALTAVGGWSRDRTVMEDWELGIRLTAAGYGVQFVPEPLVRFRRWGHGNLSSRGFKHMRANLGTVAHHEALYRATLGVGGTLAVAGRVVYDEGARRGGPSGKALCGLGWLLGHRGEASQILPAGQGARSTP
jgi:glycosyltransferase involved in cell wall biosynthesis